jgi:Tol biopolymer transport system component
MAAAMEPRAGKLTGDPAPVLSGIATDLTTWHAGFSAATGGLLAYYNVDPDAGGSPRGAAGIPSTGAAKRIAQYARDGKPVTYFFDGVLNDGVRVSFDGKKLATCATPPDAANTDVWICDIRNIEEGVVPEAAIETTRLTFEPGNKRATVWSPDGREIAYANSSPWAGDAPGIYIKSVNGGTERLVLARHEGDRDDWPEDWSRDGKYLIFVRGSWITAGYNDVWALPLAGGEPFVVAASPADDQQAALSPDNRWLAYQREESNGVYDIFVVPFMHGWDGAATKPATQSRWRVSESGGSRPRWRGDGKELYYLNLSGSMIAVKVVADADVVRFESRTALFQIKGDPITAAYDVSPDGRYFFVQDLDIPSDRAIALVQGWQRLLRGPRP